MWCEVGQRKHVAAKQLKIYLYKRIQTFFFLTGVSRKASSDPHAECKGQTEFEQCC